MLIIMSYEAEKKELFEIYKKKTEEYFKALDEEIKTRGYPTRDSVLDYQHHLDNMEYNKKFLELKKKYGVK